MPLHSELLQDIISVNHLKGHTVDTEQEAKKEVEIVNNESRKLADQIYKMKITSEASMNEATEVLISVKKMLKEIEKRRKSITQPLNLAIKNVNAMFKDPSERLTDAEKMIKEAMIKYQERIERRAAKKADKIEAQVDSGDLTMQEAMGKLSNVKEAKNGASVESGSTNVRTITKIRITNPAELPPKYFLRPRVIEALRLEVEEDVRKKGEPVPTGAEKYEDKQVAVRAA